MNQIEIDLNARHVTLDRRVWRMFPGENYQFLDSFLKNGLVFLQMPGLELPEGDVSEEGPDIRARLHRSRAVERWIQDYRKYTRSSMTDDPPSEPTRDLRFYANQALSRNQRQDLGAVRNLFSTAAAGDLVVVPDQIPTRKIMIGELLDPPTTRVAHSEADVFLGETTPARRVRWFPAVEELRLPRELSSILRIPPAISQIPLSLHASVYENSYGTFYREADYRPAEYVARINLRELDTQDTFDFGSLARLSSVICEAGQGSEDAFQRALINYSDQAVSDPYQPSVSINVNSPGVGILKSGSIVPLFFAAMFLIFAHGDTNQPASATKVVITNSIGDGVNDECAAQVSSAVHERLRLMGFDQWKAQCERAKRLKEDAGLTVDSKVRGSQ